MLLCLCSKNNEADVVIGPRSALFAPMANLGLIVIDEEHENIFTAVDCMNCFACANCRKITIALIRKNKFFSQRRHNFLVRRTQGIILIARTFNFKKNI